MIVSSIWRLNKGKRGLKLLPNKVIIVLSTVAQSSIPHLLRDGLCVDDCNCSPFDIASRNDDGADESYVEFVLPWHGLAMFVQP